MSIIVPLIQIYIKILEYLYIMKIILYEKQFNRLLESTTPNNLLSNWDMMHKNSVSGILTELKNSKIGGLINLDKMTKNLNPIFDSLYNIKPYLMKDTKTLNLSTKDYDTVSNETREYLYNVVVNSIIRSLDNYWNSLSYLEKKAIKLLKPPSPNYYPYQITKGLTMYFTRLSLVAQENNDDKLFDICYNISNFVDFSHNSVIVMKINRKIESLLNS